MRPLAYSDAGLNLLAKSPEGRALLAQQLTMACEVRDDCARAIERILSEYRATLAGHEDLIQRIQSALGGVPA